MADSRQSSQLNSAADTSSSSSERQRHVLTALSESPATGSHDDPVLAHPPQACSAGVGERKSNSGTRTKLNIPVAAGDRHGDTNPLGSGQVEGNLNPASAHPRPISSNSVDNESVVSLSQAPQLEEELQPSKDADLSNSSGLDSVVRAATETNPENRIPGSNSDNRSTSLHSAGTAEEIPPTFTEDDFQKDWTRLRFRNPQAENEFLCADYESQAKQLVALRACLMWGVMSIYSASRGDTSATYTVMLAAIAAVLLILAFVGEILLAKVFWPRAKAIQNNSRQILLVARVREVLMFVATVGILMVVTSMRIAVASCKTVPVFRIFHEGPGNVDNICAGGLPNVVVIASELLVLVGHPRAVFAPLVTVFGFVAVGLTSAASGVSGGMLAAGLVSLFFACLGPFSILVALENNRRQRFALQHLLAVKVKELRERKEAHLCYVESILPIPLQAKLLAGTSHLLDVSDDATCVVVDIHDYLLFSTRIMPEENAIFVVEFQELMLAAARQRGLHRVSTNGDQFVGSANVLRNQDDHASQVIYFAFDIIRLRKVLARGVRISCAQGSLVGAVVGVRSIRYDVFGPAITEALHQIQHARENTVVVNQKMRDTLVDVIDAVPIEGLCRQQSASSPPMSDSHAASHASSSGSMDNLSSGPVTTGCIFKVKRPLVNLPAADPIHDVEEMIAEEVTQNVWRRQKAAADFSSVCFDGSGTNMPVSQIQSSSLAKVEFTLSASPQGGSPQQPQLRQQQHESVSSSPGLLLNPMSEMITEAAEQQLSVSFPISRQAITRAYGMDPSALENAKGLHWTHVATCGCIASPCMRMFVDNDTEKTFQKWAYRATKGSHEVNIICTGLLAIANIIAVASTDQNQLDAAPDAATSEIAGYLLLSAATVLSAVAFVMSYVFYDARGVTKLLTVLDFLLPQLLIFGAAEMYPSVIARDLSYLNVYAIYFAFTVMVPARYSTIWIVAQNVVFIFAVASAGIPQRVPGVVVFTLIAISASVCRCANDVSDREYFAFVKATEEAMRMSDREESFRMAILRGIFPPVLHESMFKLHTNAPSSGGIVHAFIIPEMVVLVVRADSISSAQMATMCSRDLNGALTRIGDTYAAIEEAVEQQGNDVIHLMKLSGDSATIAGPLEPSKVEQEDKVAADQEWLKPLERSLFVLQHLVEGVRKLGGAGGGVGAASPAMSVSCAMTVELAATVTSTGSFPTFDIVGVAPHRVRALVNNAPPGALLATENAVRSLVHVSNVPTGVTFGDRESWRVRGVGVLGVHPVRIGPPSSPLQPPAEKHELRLDKRSTC